jgi:hypothetical protein
MLASAEYIQYYKNLALEDRLHLALRPELSPEARYCLLHIEQWLQVRCYFSRRLDLTAEEVAQLLDDADYVIRLSIAKRQDLTATQIARCVRDVDPNVRHAVARHPALTAADRQLLQQDSDPIVAQAAKKPPRPMQTRQRPAQAVLVR